MNITFKITENSSEHRFDSYWTVHRIGIMHNDEEIGHLKVRYITSDDIVKISAEVLDQMGVKNYDSFCKEWMNVPTISYAFVSKVWRGQGLGSRMYEFAAKWLQENGLYLHGSTCQTPEATYLWRKLSSLHQVDPYLEKQRLIVNINKQENAKR